MTRFALKGMLGRKLYRGRTENRIHPRRKNRDGGVSRCHSFANCLLFSIRNFNAVGFFQCHSKFDGVHYVGSHAFYQ